MESIKSINDSNMDNNDIESINNSIARKILLTTINNQVDNIINDNIENFSDRSLTIGKRNENKKK